MLTYIHFIVHESYEYLRLCWKNKDSEESKRSYKLREKWVYWIYWIWDGCSAILLTINELMGALYLNRISKCVIFFKVSNSNFIKTFLLMYTNIRWNQPWQPACLDSSPKSYFLQTRENNKNERRRPKKKKRSKKVN